MPYATDTIPLIAHDQHNNDFLLVALLLSIALHSAAIGFLPGLGKPPALVEQPLTVELTTPEPPPPIKEPEPPKPEPKPEPKPVPPPKPLVPPVQPPIQKQVTHEPPPVVAPAPRAETPPPVTETPRPAEPPPVIAVEERPTESPPAFTTPASVAAPVISDTEEDPDGYGSAMTAEFKKNVKYPQVAILRGWEGVVKVTLHIDADGNITDITIKQKSDKDTLNEAALKTARKTKLLPIPAARRGKPFTLTVPISYTLKDR